MFFVNLNPWIQDHSGSISPGLALKSQASTVHTIHQARPPSHGLQSGKTLFKKCYF
jgi:hypothetical protein